MRLDAYNNGEFDRGASKAKELLWLVVSGLCFSTWLPGSFWRVVLLRFFGAEIGVGVVIKPRVVVKFPWKLYVGDHSWVGEKAWIDNLDSVSIGSHVCISQGVYLCTGSHEWSTSSFKLITKPIVVADKAWLAAFSRVSPGVVVDQGSVLCFCSVATKSLDAWAIYSGQPAEAVKYRVKFD